MVFCGLNGKFSIIFLSDMHLSDFLCASLDQCNILGPLEQKKSSLAICTLKCGKFFSLFCGKICDFKWQFYARCHFCKFCFQCLESAGFFRFCAPTHVYILMKALWRLPKECFSVLYKYKYFFKMFETESFLWIFPDLYDMVWKLKVYKSRVVTLDI